MVLFDLRPPGQYLMEVTVGLCMINCCLSLSKVAVVSKPLRKVPAKNNKACAWIGCIISVSAAAVSGA